MGKKGGAVLFGMELDPRRNPNLSEFGGPEVTAIAALQEPHQEVTVDRGKYNKLVRVT